MSVILRKMHLVYLAHALVPSRSANSVNIMKMCAAFCRNGHEVTLIVPERPGRDTTVSDVLRYYGVEEAFSVEYVPWGSYPGRSYVYALRNALRLRARSVDVIYTRFLSGAVSASHLRAGKVIFEAHAPAGEQGQLGKLLLKSVAGKDTLSRVVVISEALRERYELDIPSIASKIVVAHDGADPITAREQPFVLDRRAGELHVGYVGQLYRGKGMELIAQLAPLCPWAQFHVVGGTQKDGDDWRARVAGVDNLKLHGFVPPAVVPRYLRSFDVLVAPYQRTVSVYGAAGDVARWMSPLKLFEYMAAGRPIVCSDLPVLGEVLRHEVNALLCDPDDVHEWVRALSRLRDAPDLRARLASKAKSIFEDQFTWTARAARVLEGLDPIGLVRSASASA